MSQVLENPNFENGIKTSRNKTIRSRLGQYINYVFLCANYVILSLKEYENQHYMQNIMNKYSVSPFLTPFALETCKFGLFPSFFIATKKWSIQLEKSFFSKEEVTAHPTLAFSL